MTGRLTSTAGYCDALETREKIEKMFDRKKKKKREKERRGNCVRCRAFEARREDEQTLRRRNAFPVAVHARSDIRVFGCEL